MSFLDFFKGKKKNGDRAALVINDRFLEVMQLQKNGKEIHLMGFNRVELPARVVEGGAIVNESAFQKSFLELISQAKPQSILTQTFRINVPFSQLFSFIKKGVSRKNSESNQQLLMNEIRKESPIPPEEMSLQFYSDEQDHQFTQGAIGWPKSWESVVRDALSQAGIRSFEFIPEPLAQQAISQTPLVKNFVLASFQDEKLYLSFFHNHLLYDSFLLESRKKTLKEGLEAYRDQFLEEVVAYKEVWAVPIEMVYFINASEASKPLIDSIAKESEISYSHLEVSLAGQLEIRHYSATLIGLALFT